MPNITYHLVITLTVSSLLPNNLGCGATSNSPDSSSARPSAPISTLTTNSISPNAVKQGRGAPVIWRNSSLNEGGACSHESSGLTISEIRADHAKLYVDVAHSSPGEFDSYKAQPIAIETRIDGCPAENPAVDGKVWRDWASPTSATVDLSKLPDGEIELVLKAFGQDATLPILLKNDSTVTQIDRKESSRYMYFPADPKRGLDAASAMIEPDCMLASAEAKR